MSNILKNAYTKFWVPVMGRFISKLIPILEGKPPEKPPTFDIDGENLNGQH
tara:strand:- start:224 stop:376 length:153 start_codon:yes stop_codon:yes gene_type:complete